MFQRNRPNFNRSNKNNSAVVRSSVLRSQLNQIRQEAQVPPVRIRIPNDVPQHTVDPSVMRVVRQLVQLTFGAPTYTCTANLISIQDATDYTGSATLRYTTVRIVSAKIWFEMPPASLTLGSPSLLVTDATASLAQFRDTGTLGQQYAKVGYQMPFSLRHQVLACTDTTPLFRVDSDQSITTGQVINVVVDTLVEFR